MYSDSEADDQIAGFPALLGEAFHPVPIFPRIAKNGLKHFAVKNPCVIENAIPAREVQLVVHTGTSLEGV
jgi:hypothetical protein